jgi:hypothetical protein
MGGNGWAFRSALEAPVLVALARAKDRPPNLTVTTLDIR